MRLSVFIIGIMIIPLFIVGFMTTISHLSDNYGVNDDQAMESMNKFKEYQQDLEANSAAIKEDSFIQDEASTDSESEDIIGKYFRGGYTALKTTTASIGVAEDMVADAGENIKLADVESVPGQGTGGFFNILSVTLGTMLVIFIFVGIVIAAVMKWRT